MMLPLPSEANLLAYLAKERTQSRFPLTRFVDSSQLHQKLQSRMSDYYERSRLYWRRRAARQGVSEAEFDRTHADDIEFMEEQAIFAARYWTNTSAPRTWIIHRALYYPWKVLGK
jgi:hypothetical protein